jgi:tRNA A-37 threonylcarbamoyl transferase component Bud32
MPKMSEAILMAARRAMKILSSPYRVGLRNALATARDTYWARFAWRVSRYELILYNRMRRHRASRDEMALRTFRRDRSEILGRGKNGYLVSANEILNGAENAVDLEGQSEVVIGRIDQDGFVHSIVGELNGIPTVTAEEFVPRERFGLTLIAKNGILAVRKEFRGNRAAFVREVQALDTLGRQGCNVPALLDLDTERLEIVMSYVVGTVVREGLAQLGAVIRDRDVKDSGLNHLTAAELRLARIQEGRKMLSAVVDSDAVESLARQLRIMHANRIVWGDIKFGNVVIEKHSGAPFLIDFDRASYHPNASHRVFRRLADHDIEMFNLHFGTDMLTVERLRRKAAQIHRKSVYAPACFAAGISIGDLWDNSDGYGRWRYMLKEALPTMQGARILDLGANNAFNALQMLRNGAREVVAVELDEVYFQQGKFMRAAFEYTDFRDYALRYIHANMVDVTGLDLGQFDFVTALCCIYYLDDADITKVAAHVAKITGTFVLQCNTMRQIGRSDSRTYDKATVEYAQAILTGAGFTNIEIIAPSGYHRPVVIGRRPHS